MKERKRILLVFGTRPEAIKFAPIYKVFNDDMINFETKVCITSQHKEMLQQIISFYEIKVDYDLNLMSNNQSLLSLAANGIIGLDEIVKDFCPDLILVQGDTTTAFLGAYVAKMNNVFVGHIEAGLRSGNKLSPFPEEYNRVLIGGLADFHFAPTSSARQNLENEGISSGVFVVGNTVIDSLFQGLLKLEKNQVQISSIKLKSIQLKNKVILITAHRRESFGLPLENICEAIIELSELYSDFDFVFPVHLNPNVQTVVNKYLNNKNNIHLLEPLSYPDLIWMLNKSYLVLTDSGGIQEEAPSLGKPVVVLRDTTEREEGIDAGNAVLVGTNKSKIVEEVIKIIDNEDVYKRMSNAINPYGDGNSARKIYDVIKGELLEQNV
jgi:UDP-N-acetylglucosamine 2-epimerase (non-hydrolysing)